MSDEEIITISQAKQEDYKKEIKKLNDILTNMECIKDILFNSVVDEVHKALFSNLLREIYSKRDKLERTIIDLAKSVNKKLQKKYKIN
ncbi:hypothetical protein LCGC14_1512020 [marine sediment metagenome]|uniref:Uncharacterized protein n=1 Tax=marine sediment metagenome TaxID=412755 RepID=A0A0F9M2A0_9ZZZZ